MIFPRLRLKQGRNILLVAVHTNGNGFFLGLNPAPEYKVANLGVGYTFSKNSNSYRTTPLPLTSVPKMSFDLAGWQFDIAFDPRLHLKPLNVSEGNFLKAGWQEPLSFRVEALITQQVKLGDSVQRTACPAQGVGPASGIPASGEVQSKSAGFVWWKKRS